MDIVVLKKVKTSLLVPIGEKIIFDKRKKKQMWLILMSLHNLPRIYLDGDGEFDNLKEMLILPNDALQYSNLYLMELARNNAGSV